MLFEFLFSVIIFLALCSLPCSRTSPCEQCALISALDSKLSLHNDLGSAPGGGGVSGDPDRSGGGERGDVRTYSYVNPGPSKKFGVSINAV